MAINSKVNWFPDRSGQFFLPHKIEKLFFFFSIIDVAFEHQFLFHLLKKFLRSFVPILIVKHILLLNENEGSLLSGKETIFYWWIKAEENMKLKNIWHLKDGSVDTLGPRETENICSMISKSECIDKCIM